MLGATLGHPDSHAPPLRQESQQSAISTTHARSPFARGWRDTARVTPERPTKENRSCDA